MIWNYQVNYLGSSDISCLYARHYYEEVPVETLDCQVNVEEQRGCLRKCPMEKPSSWGCIMKGRGLHEVRLVVPLKMKNYE